MRQSICSYIMVFQELKETGHDQACATAPAPHKQAGQRITLAWLLTSVQLLCDPTLIDSTTFTILGMS